MSKEVRNGWLAFLIPIIGLIVYGVIYKSCNDGKDDYYYLVEETGYFHSTKNAEKCRFIKLAKEENYHINKKSRLWVVANNKRICKHCFTKEEQQSFLKESARAKLLARRLEEHSKWMKLGSDSDCDYDNLTVYIDSTNKIHIDGNCIMILNKTAVRTSLENIEHIDNTCEDCVGRWICDFIYKAVYERVYDKEVIKNPEEQCDDEDYYYLPEPGR